MGQTEEIRMMSRSNRFNYVPITRGHKPTASQESNTFSTTSEASCITTLSLDSEAGQIQAREEGRVPGVPGEEGGLVSRSGSEETVDTVITVKDNKNHKAGETDKRMKSRNSDYGSYCGSPDYRDRHRTGPGQDSRDRRQGGYHIETEGGGQGKVSAVQAGSVPLLPSDSEEGEDESAYSSHPSLHGSVKLDMPSPSNADNKPGRIPGEPLKTLLSGLFLGTGFLATTFSLAFTHERVPDIQPLPDIVLDNIQYQPWGLDVSEVLLMANTLTAVLVVLFHSHRCIIFRRIWLILGILYYFRALTMTVTVLPKADKYYECLPRQNETTPLMYLQRVIMIISGGGLSINGKHVFCGDYIFSGHTMTLTLGYLAIKQYSPRRFILLHWASFLAALCGVIFLVLARGHYTIDVIVAYFVSSRLWWIYHTLAHNDNLKTQGPHNQLSNLCWWHIFRYFEGKTSGPLPHRYSLPLPRRVKRWVCRLTKRVWGGVRDHPRDHSRDRDIDHEQASPGGDGRH